MENFLGQIIMISGNFIPRGYLPCDGRLLPIHLYVALYSLIGVTYGGDGRNNFALPNLMDRVPIHMSTENPTGQLVSRGHGEDTTIRTTPIKYCICIAGIYPARD